MHIVCLIQGCVLSTSQRQDCLDLLPTIILYDRMLPLSLNPVYLPSPKRIKASNGGSGSITTAFFPAIYFRTSIKKSEFADVVCSLDSHNMHLILGYLNTCSKIVGKVQPHSEIFHLLRNIFSPGSQNHNRSSTFAIVLILQDFLRRPSKWDLISPSFTRIRLLGSQHSYSLSLNGYWQTFAQRFFHSNPNWSTRQLCWIRVGRMTPTFAGICHLRCRSDVAPSPNSLERKGTRTGDSASTLPIPCLFTDRTL